MWPKLFEARREKYLRPDTQSTDFAAGIVILHPPHPVPDTCADSLQQKQKLETRFWKNNDDGCVSVRLFDFFLLFFLLDHDTF